MMKWSILTLIALLGAAGCSGDGQELSKESPQASEESIADAESEVPSQDATTPEEVVIKKTTLDKKASRQGRTAPRRDDGLNALREKGAERGAAPAKPVTRASTRVAPPKGMDAHPDFVGARVGLIQTANVMGEVDPCG